MNKVLSKINIAALGLALCTLTAPKVHAADTLIFSTPSGTVPITDGSATITSTSTIFYDSTTSTASVASNGGTSPNNEILEFGANNFGSAETGTAGTVTVSGTVQAAGLSFLTPNAGNYTLSGGTIALQGAATSIVDSALGATTLDTLTTASGSTLTISGSDAGGTNQLFIANAGNSFGGGTNGTITLTATNLILQVFNADLTGAATINVNSATGGVRFNDTSSFVNSANWSITGTGDGSRGAIGTYAGNNVTATFNGTISLTGSAQTQSRDNVIYNGNLSSGSSSLFTLEGEFNNLTYTLNGNNSSLAGGIKTESLALGSTVEETIKVGATSTSALGTGVLTLDTEADGAGSSVQIDLNGQSLSVGGIAGGDNTRFIGNSASTAATLTVTTAAAGTSFAGTIEDGTTTATYASASGYTFTQVGSGKTALTENGSGVLTLTGTNTYTGHTTITSGGIKLGASASLSSGVIEDDAANGFDVSSITAGFTLGATQELAGNGSVKGQINTVSGSMINPGSLTTPGKLTLSNGLNVTTSGLDLTFRLDNTSNSDELVLGGGAFTESAGTIINLLNGGTFAGAGTYSILDASQIGAGDVTLADYTLGTTIAGYTETLVVNGADDILEVQVAAVPEPSTYAMLLGGLVMLVGIGKFRRRGAYVD